MCELGKFINKLVKKIAIGTILVIIIIAGYILWLRRKTDDFKKVIVGVKIDQSLQQDMQQKEIEKDCE